MAELNWRAIGLGFVVTLVLGLLSGNSIPLTDLTLPVIGWGLTGIVGGLAAGYVAGRGMGNGAVNGIVATTIGAILVYAVLAVFGTVLFGFVGFTVALVGLLYLGLYAIPGAVGGAVGAMLNRSSPADRTQPAGR
ncbi:hypothetical protein AUR64_13600 [Haloprofundus marisrubri]|uniref:DUF5518 domain-containing protein n=1 Tax=Haloprofundus marisrubri TaxID=1514971 RepID=A0A0W1R902_9EURY|nr:DUF5518 domain-containing protein [Haloprofundus marisrubri]KTG09543.1 hypothetical protein AUR64_13600 [Haloprofundus marisrubri]